MEQKNPIYKKYMIVRIGDRKMQCIVADDMLAVFCRYDGDNPGGGSGIDMTDTSVRVQNIPGKHIEIVSDGIGVKGLATYEEAIKMMQG